MATFKEKINSYKNALYALHVGLTFVRLWIINDILLVQDVKQTPAWSCPLIDQIASTATANVAMQLVLALFACFCVSQKFVGGILFTGIASLMAAGFIFPTFLFDTKIQEKVIAPDVLEFDCSWLAMFVLCFAIGFLSVRLYALLSAVEYVAEYKTALEDRDEVVRGPSVIVKLDPTVSVI